MQEVDFEICPKCGSEDLECKISNNVQVLSCSECNFYYSVSIQERKKKDKKPKKENWN